MIQKTKGLKRKEAEILIENKGSSPIWFSFCARKQQETQNLSSGQTLCRSVSRAWAQGYSSSAVPVLDGQIWDKRESQVSANTEPALQLFCKTVSCSPLSPWQSGPWTQLCSQCFRDSRSSSSSSHICCPEGDSVGLHVGRSQGRGNSWPYTGQQLHLHWCYFSWNNTYWKRFSQSKPLSSILKPQKASVGC